MTDEWKLIPIIGLPSIAMGIGLNFCLAAEPPYLFRSGRHWLGWAMAAIPVAIITTGTLFAADVNSEVYSPLPFRALAAGLSGIAALFQFPLAVIAIFLSAVLPAKRSYFRIAAATLASVVLVCAAAVSALAAGQMLSGVSL